MSSGKRLLLVEVILDHCGLTNGAAPCGATAPCDNTWYTCESTCDYQCTPVSYWFSNCEVPGHLFAERPEVIGALPIIKSWDHKPSKLVPGSFSQSTGNIQICFNDLKACDGLEGFVLARLIEAQKYFEGREVRVWQGDCDMSFGELLPSRFFIDRLVGPNKKCEVLLEASDPTSLIGFDKAVCPTRERLLDTIYELPIELSLKTELQGLPTTSDPNFNPNLLVDTFILANHYLPDNNGPIDRFFRDTRFLCSGGELLEVIGCINEDAAPTPGWNFKLVSRGYCSPIESHDAGARLEPAKSFINVHAVDVIRCLMQDCANLDAVAVACCGEDVPSLLSEYYLQQYECKRRSDIIAEAIFCSPEDVGELLDCLAKELNLSIFYDDLCDTIVVKPYCPPNPDDPIKVVMPYDIIRDSVDIRPSDDRYSAVIYNHDVVDCAEGPGEGNYRCSTSVENIDAYREVCDRREYKTTRDLIINSKWINRGNAYLASVNASRHAAIAACPPREVRLDVVPRFARGLYMGDIVQIQHEKLSSRGEFSQAFWMFTGRKMLNDCVRLCFIETPWAAGEYRNSYVCDENGEPTIAPRPDRLCDLKDCPRVW